MATLSYDFFLPRSKAGRTFADALGEFAALATADRRLDCGTHYFDLVEVKQHHGGTSTGLIQRNRMRHLPPSGDSRNGTLGRINLPGHLGVSDVAACLCDRRRNALCVQRSRYGISHATLRRLLNGAVGSDFVFVPILSENAMTRLGHLQDHHKLTVKFATPRSPDYYSNAGGGIGDVAKFMKRMAAMQVKVEVSPISKADRLSPQGIKEIIAAAIGLGEEDDGFKLKALSVRGGNDDGEAEVVDFINARFKAQAELVETDARHTDHEHLRTQIRAAYNEHGSYIQHYCDQLGAAATSAGS